MLRVRNELVKCTVVHTPVQMCTMRSWLRTDVLHYLAPDGYHGDYVTWVLLESTDVANLATLGVRVSSPRNKRAGYSNGSISNPLSKRTGCSMMPISNHRGKLTVYSRTRISKMCHLYSLWPIKGPPKICYNL